ncbi:MAG: hypothetical protein EAZ42_01555 [Verrucomicrobia bacterium]|nr:MAG: hypothetical protein EAZ42_01555 [Verrucomicrobiota bacterium]
MKKPSTKSSRIWLAQLALVAPDNAKVNTFLSCLVQGTSLREALLELKTTIRKMYIEDKENEHSLPSGAKVYLHQTVEIGAMTTDASCLFMSGTMDMKTIGIDIPDCEEDIIPIFTCPEPLIPDGLKRDNPYAIRNSDGRIIRLEPFLILPDLR